MTNTPINLNRERKARAKMKKRAQADENAVKLGRKKSEKLRNAAQVASLDTKLDGHKRET